MTTPKMICVGSAAQDVFLTGKVFTPKCEGGICYEHLKLGDKFAVEQLIYAPGGNAMHASVTFARQGLDTSFVGLIGDDPAGQALLAEFDKESIHTQHVVSDSEFTTSYSTILLAPNGERTILNYHGEPLSSRPDIISSDVLKGDWLYVSAVGSMEVLKTIVTTAKTNGMKIAFNPATAELAHPQACADIFEHIDLLALNKEEAQLFVDGTDIVTLARELAKSTEYVLVSDGPRGAVATDGTVLVKAGLYEDVPVIDRTGAGDAFTSGFVAHVATGASLKKALIFASANSTSVVGAIGATEGILHTGADIHDMPVEEVDHNE